ncbi:histidinol-phosphate aminotransferase family protein [bacterium]|nr:histidinol-phosphate aminotransferase family protein [candidate division CSSED10-310 bacterium]
MDQNESPWDLPPEMKADLLAELQSASWNRYPQPQHYQAVKKRFADTLQIDPDSLAITVGCDEAIQGVHFLAGGSHRKALVFQPTYPMLTHAAFMAGTMVEEIELSPEYHIRSSLLTPCDLMLIANPNNPTGNLTDQSIILTALDQSCMVFIDEAYFDFSKVTVYELLKDYPNLAIGRSCSKSMLAGIRLGALIGRPRLIRNFESIVTSPYNLSHIQLVTAARFNELLPYINTACSKLVRERELMSNSLSSMGLKFYPSATNFILFRVDNAPTIHKELLKHGIRLRDMSRLRGLKNHLRVTVGTPEENVYFCEKLRKLL